MRMKKLFFIVWMSKSTFAKTATKNTKRTAATTLKTFWPLSSKIGRIWWTTPKTSPGSKSTEMWPPRENSKIQQQTICPILTLLHYKWYSEISSRGYMKKYMRSESLVKRAVWRNYSKWGISCKCLWASYRKCSRGQAWPVFSPRLWKPRVKRTIWKFIKGLASKKSSYCSDGSTTSAWNNFNKLCLHSAKRSKIYN